MNYPSDEFAERTCLGIILLKPKENFDALVQLNSEDFFVDNFKNRYVFDAFRNLVDNGKPIDITTVTSYLSDNNNLERIGGVDYLVSLTDLVTTYKNINYYVKILKDKTLLRTFLLKIEDIQNRYEKGIGDDIGDFVSKSEGELLNITSKRRVKDFDKIQDLGVVVGEKIRSKHGSGDELLGYTTGFSNLDGYINGMMKGSLIVLAARPAVGKSALALNIAYNCAKKCNKAVAYFTYEMSNESLVTRLFCSRASVNFDQINKGILSNDDRLRVRETEEEFSKVPLYMDESQNTNIDDLIVKVRKLNEDTNNNLGVIVVDHLGIMGEEKGFERKSDQERIASRSRKLKQLAIELNIPVLCVAQLNRNVEERDNKYPQLSDLRQSGSIEQDADQVLLLFRKNYYKEQGISTQKSYKKGQEPEANNETNNESNAPDGADIVTINIAKNRSGKAGRTFLYFFKAYCKFDVPTKEALESLNKMKE